ncbi:hypothetical protein SORBI_3001G462401 [Sorghum bicolor]|uniref:Pentacotripeptide-repeat region of PRORP domain-containing protein n=1 Tax=Sorghum bicolor TaxID=4558 RepID=A0A1Z5SAT3_SORBI|nr:hypothetical protein SORBI_3001G462401 [Sorghum bicolor]
MPPKPAPRLFQYISNKSRKPPPAATSAAPSASHDGPASDADADAGEVYRIVTSAATPSAMESALAASAVPLSSPLLDAVMRRFRFAHGDPLRALSLLSLAADRGGVAPSPYAIDTALYVLGRARRFPHMWDLLATTRRICPDAVTSRTAMIVLGRVAKVCSVHETVASFRRLARMFHAVDPACLFNALLRTLCQEKSMSDARNVFHALKYDFRVNRHTFNILLSGWKSAEDAEAFVAEMRELGVEPDLVTYNSLIDCHCKNRDVEKAYKLLDEMREKDISPDIITYTSLIGGLGLIGQPDKARDLLKEMHELGLCHRYGKVGQALELWSDMVSNRFGSFTLVSDVLFDLLCDEGKLEEVERCFCQMVEFGQKPSNVAFRRIKILMQVAKQEESIARLTEKMAQFGRLAPEDCQRVHSVESRTSNGDTADAGLPRAA